MTSSPCLRPLAAALFAVSCANAQAQQPLAESAETLPAVTVRGAADAGYAVRNSVSATKTDTPLIETPFSVQVVPQEVIQDQQAYRLQDVVRNVSNTFSTSTSIAYEGLISRGFETVPFLDGTKTYFLILPVSNAERVEVFKGPAAAIYGRIEPGGMVNVVTRKPQFSTYRAIEQQFGSDNFLRTQGDFTGPLNEAKTLAYRVNFEYQDNDTFRKFESFNRVFFNPSFTWKPDDATRIDVSYYHREDTQLGSATGVPAIGERPAPVSIRRNYGEPGFDSKFEIDGLFVNASHELNRQWTLRAGLSAWQGDYDYGLVGFNFPQDNEQFLDRYYLVSDYDKRNTRNANLELVGKVDTGAVKHTVLFGVDFAKFDERSDWFGDNAGKYPFPVISIFNPQFRQVPRASTLLREKPDAYFVREETSLGFNVQDQLAFGDRWIVLLGSRYDRTRASSGFTDTSMADAEAASTERRINRFSPRGGIVFKLTPAVSLYSSYAESFGSNNGGRSFDGKPFDPETAKQYEAGVKADLFGGSLSVTTALFELTKQNILTDDLDHPGFSVTIGEARSRGIEVDLQGRIGRNLDVIGGFALTDTEIMRDRYGNQGNRLSNAPRRSGSLSLSYRLSDDLTLGGGAWFAGSREGDLENSFRLPGYARVDLHAAYRWQWNGSRMTARLNLNNVLDKKYYAASGGRGDILAGEPFNAMVSLRAEF